MEEKLGNQIEREYPELKFCSGYVPPTFSYEISLLDLMLREGLTFFFFSFNSLSFCFVIT